MAKRRRRFGWAGALLVVAIVAVLVGAAGLIIPRLSGGGATTATDMHGNSVQLDPGEIPVPAASSSAQADLGERLVVSSVGLNVPLGALNAVNGQITPPGFTSAYRVRNMGVDVPNGRTGTVFVVMHSLRNGGMAPGNYITDVAHARSKVSDGATVSVAGVKYTVSGSELITKKTIASNSRVWADTPNRLLLITCLEHADGSPSTDNLVITAMRDS